MASGDDTDDSPIARISIAIGRTVVFILMGYAFRAAQILSSQSASGVNRLVGRLLLPLVLFRGMASLDFGSVDMALVAAIYLAKAIIFVLAAGFGALSSHRPHRRLGKAGIFAIFATQSNNIAFGYPLIAAMRPEMVPYIFLAAPGQQVVLNPLGFALMEAGHAMHGPDRVRGDLSLRSIAVKITRKLVTNPVVVMTFLGLLWGRLVPSFGGFLGSILDSCDQAFQFTALFALGSGVYGKANSLRMDKLVQPLLLVVLKVVAMPIVGRVLLGIIRPHAEQRFLDFVVVYGALPTAPSVFIYATQFSTMPDRISSATVLCLCLSVPLLYLSILLINAGSTSTALWTAVLEGEQTLAWAAAGAAALLLLAGTASRLLRRSPNHLGLHLATSQLLFVVLNNVCSLEHATNARAKSVPSRLVYLAEYAARIDQRFILLITAYVLSVLAHRGTLSPRFLAVAPWCAHVLAVAIAAAWFTFGSPHVNFGTNHLCWCRYGGPELFTDCGIMFLCMVAQGVCMLRAEAGARVHSLPNNLTTVCGSRAASRADGKAGGKQLAAGLLREATKDPPDRPRSAVQRRAMEHRREQQEQQQPIRRLASASALLTAASRAVDGPGGSYEPPREPHHSSPDATLAIELGAVRRTSVSGTSLSQRGPFDVGDTTFVADSPRSTRSDSGSGSDSDSEGVGTAPSKNVPPSDFGEGHTPASISDKVRIQLQLTWAMAQYVATIAVFSVYAVGGVDLAGDGTVLHMRLVAIVLTICASMPHALIWLSHPRIRAECYGSYLRLLSRLRRHVHGIEDVGLLLERNVAGEDVSDASSVSSLASGASASSSSAAARVFRSITGASRERPMRAGADALGVHPVLFRLFRDMARDFGRRPQASVRGRELVTWLVRRGYALDRDDAINVGERLFFDGVLQAFTERMKTFEDSDYLYKLGFVNADADDAPGQ